MAAIQPGQPGPCLEPQMGPRSASDSDSDSDSPASGRAQPDTGFSAHSQVIHSGHFMVSSPHSDATSRRRHHLAESQPPAPPSIDPTLTRLFECMSLAYSGKLVSPKWKNFKGLRLLCRDKIRLNNAIWRAWYIQYVERRRSPVCGFVTPLDGSEADEHRKPEAVVLEGNYWKRRIEVVMKEYHKWRIYHKKKLHRFSQEEEVPSPRLEEEGWARTDHWCDQLFCNVVPMLLRDKEEEEERRQLFDVDTFLSDISDTLFTMTQGSGPSQPLPEDAYAGNADMIQPDLTPLQPNLDDFMEISDFFSSPRPLPAQAPLSYQDPPCFGPGPETLFGSSDGTLLPSPEDGLLPPGPPVSPGLSGPRLQPAGGGSTALPSPGSFLSPGLPAAPVAPAAPGLEGKQKPLLPYSCPSKWLSLDHCGPYAPPPLPSPASAPAPRPRLPHAPLLCPVPPTPCFPQDSPGYSMALPPGYHPHPHFSAPTLPPAGATGPIRGAVRPASDGLRAKGVSGKAKRAPRSTASLHGAHPTPCLAQLLTPAKVEPGPEAEPAPSTAPLPAFLESLPNAFFAESSSFVPRMSQPSPRLSPVSSPPQRIPASPPALLVPKAERLSPTPACGRSRQTPGSLEGPVSTSHFACGRSRTEPSKVESRRITHISAEQKRRFNIKLGFDTLHSLVSTLSTQPSLKVSKATTLQKTSEYICKLQQERAALQEEAQRLRDQIEELNAAINLCQQQLPATGVPITRQRFDQMRDMFDEYVRSCTLQNWKFWVFSILMRPLFESFNGMVSTASLESFGETSLAWLDQCCSLPALRPAVLSSLRQLSISTSILTNPADVPEQATQAVTGAAPNSGSS